MFASLGHPCKCQRVSRLGSVTARHSSCGRQSAKLCGVEQRAPPIFGRAAIALGIGPHSSCRFVYCLGLAFCVFFCFSFDSFALGLVFSLDLLHQEIGWKGSPQNGRFVSSGM